MNCQGCPLNKSGKPTIRRQSEFKHKLRIVMSHPPFNFVDPALVSTNTVETIKRWCPEEFDVVFTLNCTAGRLLDRTNEERVAKIAATNREALRHCSDTLKSDLEGAEVVVLCGNRVLNAFGFSESVGNLTGWVEEQNGVTYLATWDVHDVEDYPVDKWKDFAWTVQKAAAIVAGEAPRSNEAQTTDWVDLDNLEKALEYMRAVPDGAVVVTDLETAGLDFWDKSQPILQIGIWDIGKSQLPAVIYPEVFNDPAFLEGWNSMHRRVKLLGQNLKFDACYAKTQIPGMEFNIHYELRLIHHLIDERTGTHNLAHMLRVYLNWKDYWSELENKYLKTGLGYAKAERKELAQYLALDLVGTGEVFKVLLKELRDDRKKPYKWPILLSQKEQVEKIYPELSTLLAEVERKGCRIDKKELLALRDTYAPVVGEKRDEIEGKILDLVKEEFSVDSPVQLLKALKQASILPATADSVSKKVLSDFMDNELIREILEYRVDKKLLDTFIEGSLQKAIEVEDSSWLLMSKFDPAGTIGSRWTSYNPNLQQLPRKGPFKRVIIPSKAGRLLVQSDFSSLEARVAAFLSGDEALRDGCIGDLHTMVSNRSFSKHLEAVSSFSQFTDLMRYLSSQGLLMPAFKSLSATDLSKLSDPLTYAKDLVRDHLRSCAKVITYGIFFGRGAKALAIQELNCSVEEAEYFISEYFKLFPKLHSWIQEVHSLVEREGIIIEPGGLVRDLRGWMFSADPSNRRRFLAGAKRKAVNFLTQTFGGTLQNMAIIKTHRYLEEHKVGEIRMGVHDSVVYEIDDNSETLGHILAIRDLQKVLREPDWLCVTDQQVGDTYGTLKDLDKYFSLK